MNAREASFGSFSGEITHCFPPPVYTRLLTFEQPMSGVEGKFRRRGLGGRIADLTAGLTSH